MNKNRAQSLLELAAVIVLIAATIFIGGPTIIRGINAHFKIWDDSVQDSYKDPLREVPMQIVPLCTCDSVPLGGPGLRCGVSPCPPTQRLESILCNPVGCGVTLGIDEEYCVVDPTCCDLAADTDLCGLGGPAPDCPLGERVTRRHCGGNITSFGCRPDSTPASGDGNPSCVPHCMGSYHPNEASAASNPTIPVICPGDDTNLTAGPWVQNATQGIGILVTLAGNTVSACSDPQECQAYCAPPSYQVGNGCVVPTCTDGIHNGNETGVDCGGAMCPPCTIPNHWINVIDVYGACDNTHPCEDVCAAAGLVAGVSPEGMECASGELRPASSNGTIKYCAGCWPDCDENLTNKITHDIYPPHYMCYGIGGKHDQDGTDRLIACYCDYAVCPSMLTVNTACGPAKIYPSKVAGPLTFPCPGCDGSINVTCNSDGTFSNVSENCTVACPAQTFNLGSCSVYYPPSATGSSVTPVCQGHPNCIPTGIYSPVCQSDHTFNRPGVAECYEWVPESTGGG